MFNEDGVFDINSTMRPVAVFDVNEKSDRPTNNPYSALPSRQPVDIIGLFSE